jgi:hypothetical protein
MVDYYLLSFVCDTAVALISIDEFISTIKPSSYSPVLDEQVLRIFVVFPFPKVNILTFCSNFKEILILVGSKQGENHADAHHSQTVNNGEHQLLVASKTEYAEQFDCNIEVESFVEETQK